MAKILITGAAGFIGSSLVTRLHRMGHRIVGVDNLSTGNLENLKPVRNDPNFRFIKADVEDPMIADDVRGINYVMHFASLASPADFASHPIKILDTNLIGTKNMLELARKHDARFVFASSSEVYGNTEVIPIPETYNGNSNIIGVRGCYDEGKRGGEAYAMAYKRRYGLDVRLCRIFNTYGEHMPKDGRAIPNFIESILAKEPLTIYGDGTQTRAFLYIDDLIEGIIGQTFTEGLSGIPINLGATKETTINELVHMIGNYRGNYITVKFPLPEDDPFRRLPDISRAKELLKWEPKIELREGIRRTIINWR